MASAHPARVEPTDIAIVGIALRFPGAHGPQQFWANLRAGHEAVQRFGDDELTARGVPHALLADPAYVKAGFVLAGLDLFDAEFFGFSPKDAAILDPQHRHFLECAWEALEDAGHPPATFRGPIGVFGGCGMGSYFTHNLLTNPALVESVGPFLLRHTGNDKDFLTTRVSYCLDLRGPSLGVQTACSTSLVAVHLACQSLHAGECDLALAGGVTLELPHGVGYLHRPGEILSPDGHCRPFDHRAQGTLFGSGVGIVVLRPVEDALRDGDRIYALIKGSAVNNDGAGKVSYLAPSVDGQAAVVAEALAAAGLEADALEYVEAHGSGTPMGELIEVAALKQAFGRRSPLRPTRCGLGSVKANIGHLDTAAGVAGLIKTALALQHGELPPTPNFEAPNPAIPFADSPFYVVDRLQPWPRGARPRRAGVTALGVGGTNAHVVLEEPPLAAPTSSAHSEWQVLCVSARSKRALDGASRRLAAHLRENPGQALADVAFTLLAGRRGFEQRRVLCCRDGAEAAALLESAEPQRVFTHAAGPTPASVVFLLPGGGAQHARMGAALYESEPAFRALVERGLDAFAQRSGRDLRALWLASDSAHELERPSLQLPLLFVLEFALAQFWISLGVRPAALIGHSLGENTAACLAGVLSFEDALALVGLRGELLEQLPPSGMLSVPLAADESAGWLGHELDLAALNAPGISVVSGPSAPLEDLARRLAAHDIETRRIPITTAAHSRMVEPILPRFLEFLRGIRLHPPRIPFLSNSSGTWITPEQAVRPEYWAEHLRSTVRFGDGLRTLLAEPARVFLEVGPGKTLSSLVRQQPEARGARGVIASLRHPEEKVSDVAHFRTAFGRLWACGVALDTDFLWRGERRARVSLPTYPFQHQRHWIAPGPAREAVGTAPAEPHRISLLSEGFYRPVWKPRPRDAEPVAGPPCTWLLFLDEAGLGELLAQRLRARGDRVVLVRESDDNRRLAEGEYALAPERGRDGYVELVQDLVATDAMPQRIVHLWMLTPDESFRPGSNFFHRNLERGFYSLFFLAQALGEQELSQPGSLHISVVGNGMQALAGELLLHPEKATVLGPVQVIPREFPGLSCASVDLPLAVSGARATRRPVRAARLNALLDLVEGEVLSAPRCALVAYREDQRYEQELERIALAPAGQSGHPPLRERGVYLVTGGLGGLGLVVAAHLAREARARLVLVGRAPVPERAAWDEWLAQHDGDDPGSRRIHAVRALEDAGAEVLLARADVTDVEAMRAVLEETKRRFGALNGVFHAAGVVRDAPLLTKTQLDVEEVFAPKIHGTRVLDALLADVELDFLVLFSSLSALVAPAGQVDYVAANAFLDAYARSVDGRRIVAIDWGIWNAVGMTAKAFAPAPPTARAALATQALPLDAPQVLTAHYGPETHWLLDEHRTLAGRAVVPGAAYLELARAALVAARESPVFELQDLHCLRPLHVPDGEARVVEVELHPDGGARGFRVRSRAPAPGARAAGAAAAAETHAEALLLRDPPPGPEPVPLAEIEARCVLRRSAHGPASLPCKQDELMRFGPRWRTLREVYVGSNEVLATLELPPGFAADLEQYGLHPALLDIATSCGLELFEPSAEPRPPASNGASGANGNGARRSKDPQPPRGSSSARLWVPLSYKRVRVHAPLSTRLRSWVKSHPTNRADGEILLFDVVVLAADGSVCLEIEEFALRSVAHEFAPPSPRAPAGPGAVNGAPAASVEAPGPGASPGRAALQRNLELGIRPAEGMEALMRILAAPELKQVVATSIDLAGLLRQAEALGAAPDAAAAQRTDPELGREFADSPDGIERTLAGFWRELLGVRHVGLRESFFDLGGHSLIAVRLFARIRRTYQVDFPISLLFETPTIERCAEAIRRATRVAPKAPGVLAGPAEPHPTHLVAMHPGQGGDRTPFFLVAGMFGNVLNLRHLARLLGDERRIFGLQARGLYGTQRPHESFEEMAQDYLLELRRVQPAGPYLLGGFSGGGITAYEMGLQLRAAGEEVAFLALLDSAPPRPPVPSRSERARLLWQRVRRQGPSAVREWARDRLRWELARLRKRQSGVAGVRQPSEFRSEEIGAAFRRALEHYTVRPYPGSLTLFRPKLEVAHVLGSGRQTNARREFVFPDNGWAAHVAQLDVCEVPGDHDSMVLEPSVRVLAARLRACIHAVESGTRPTRNPARIHVPSV